MKNRVVPFPKVHTPIQGDAMGIVMEYMDGDALIVVTDRYYANKTPEQDRIDRERLAESIYDLFESTIDGEAV